MLKSVFIFIVLVACISLGQNTQTSYQNSELISPIAELATPQWSIRLPSASCLSCFAKGTEVLYHLGDSELTVYSLSDGEFLWDYSGANNEEILFGESQFYIATESNVTALNELTGLAVWTFESSNTLLKNDWKTRGFQFENGNVYIQTTEHFIALNSENGQVAWLKERDWNYHEVRYASSERIIFEISDLPKEPTRPSSVENGVIALNPNSGETLWTLTFQLNAYAFHVDDKHVFFARAIPARNYAIELKQYSSQTGELIADCEEGSGVHIASRYFGFNWQAMLQSSNFKIEGDWIYLITRLSDEPNTDLPLDIYRFPLCQEPWQFSSTEPTEVSQYWETYSLPTMLYADIQPFFIIAGPYKGSFLLSDNHLLVKTLEAPAITYSERVNYPYSFIQPGFRVGTFQYRGETTTLSKAFSGVSVPIARLDIINNNVVIAQIDGTVQIHDFDTTETNSRFRVNWNNFGESILAEDLIIIQTQGEAHAFQK